MQVAMQTLRASAAGQNEDVLGQGQAPWIARLLLLAITFPRSQVRTEFQDDCRAVWKAFVEEEKAGPLVRSKLCQDIGGRKWPKNFQDAFVDHLYPYLISLGNDRYQQLREVRGAVDSFEKEPYLYLAEIYKAVASNPKRLSFITPILPSVTLLLWTRKDQGYPEFYYLNEAASIAPNFVSFARRHGSDFLAAIDYDLTEEQFGGLAEMVTIAPESDWASLACISEVGDRKKAARNAMVKKSQMEEKKRQEDHERV